MSSEKKKQITITFYLYDSSITITDTTIENAYKLFLKKYGNSNFYSELHEVVISENGEDLNPYTGDAFKKEYKYLEGSMSSEKLKKDKTFHITISELTAKTIKVKAKNKDMAWDKIQNDGYWEYEQVGNDKCIEWNYADCEEVNE